MKYLILVTSDNTRDTQVYAGPADEPDKSFCDEWQDYKNAEVYVGIYTAKTALLAIEEAADEVELPKESLRAICLGSGTNLLTHQDAITYLRRRYGLSMHAEGTEEYQACARRFREDFCMTPKSMQRNLWKILTRACTLYDKYHRYYLTEDVIWDNIIRDLKDTYHIIRKTKEEDQQ